MYDNKSERGDRPNSDEVVMVTLLVLAPAVAWALWSGTGEAGRRSALVQEVLGFPDDILEYSTVWKFRDLLTGSGKDRAIWRELQRQLDSLGLKVKRGVVQDATFITADPGHAKAATPRGEDAKTRKSKNGSWTKKGTKSYFGYKLHSNVDTDLGLIRELETTTAAVHDGQVDLSQEGEVVYRDRGYQGAEPKRYSATMRRGARDHPLGILDKLRNRRISRKRAPGERHYAVIKRVFNATHVLVTTVPRVNVKMIFTAFGFNLFQLCTLKRLGVV